MLPLYFLIGNGSFLPVTCIEFKEDFGNFFLRWISSPIVARKHLLAIELVSIVELAKHLSWRSWRKFSPLLGDKVRIRTAKEHRSWLVMCPWGQTKGCLTGRLDLSFWSFESCSCPWRHIIFGCYWSSLIRNPIFIGKLICLEGSSLASESW